MIHRELAHFVHMRHQFLISKSHSRLAQARTVLITSVPEELANERDLRLFTSFVPGGIDRVWFYRDTRVLNKLYKRREGACKKLEQAEAKILRHATLEWRMKQKKKAKKDEEGAEVDQPVSGSVELLNELVPKSKRPTHRVGFLGMFGDKVDTIEWCKVCEPIVAFSPLTLCRTKSPRSTRRSTTRENTFPRVNSWEAPSFGVTSKWVHTFSLNASATTSL